MKKYLSLILLALLLTITLTGCGTGCGNEKPSTSKNTVINTTKIHSEYFDTEVIEHLGGLCYIIMDKNTKVLYLVVGGHEGSAITPIYNADGTPMLYED